MLLLAEWGSFEAIQYNIISYCQWAVASYHGHPWPSLTCNAFFFLQDRKKNCTVKFTFGVFVGLVHRNFPPFGGRGPSLAQPLRGLPAFKAHTPNVSRGRVLITPIFGRQSFFEKSML